jgi:aminocarboxymuconate-semialdehyde decarboxylase
VAKSTRKKAKTAQRPKSAKSKTAKSKSAKTKAAKRKTSRAARGPAKKPIVIDFHAHIAVPEVLEFSYAHSEFAKASQGAGGKPQAIAEPFLLRMTDMQLRFKDMDAMGVDIQVISPSILQQCTYWAEPHEALKMERFGNDRIAEAVAKHPDRLVGLGSLPLQDVPLAIQELERCVHQLKFKGVIISSFINGLEVGDARLMPFWEKAVQLDTTVFIHPAGSPDPRMRKHRMLISIGQPLEEAFAMSSLVFEGVMDKLPKLKIVMAHGGGYLPFYTGRHDFTWLGGHHPQLKTNFSSYLPRFFYDTVLFNLDQLDFLAGKVPVNHLLLASDYPFAEKRPVEFIRRSKKISKKDQDAMLGANCAKLLGIAI